MKTTLIAAIAENGVIGKSGKIPWHIPEDLKRFKETTLHHPVIMGRKTYDSIPEKFRPLSDRTNIVLTHRPVGNGSVICAASIEDALKYCEEEHYMTMPYVIGGASIYQAALPYTQGLQITRIHKDFEGDTYFPDCWSKFVRINKLDQKGEDFDYSYELWLKKELCDLYFMDNSKI